MEDLVEQAKNNNGEAFAQLVSLVQNDLYHIALARLKNEDDVNDAIQQTVILAYQSIKQLKEPKYFKTWIIKILINECNKMYRHKQRKLIIFDNLLKKNSQIEEQSEVYYNVDNKLDLEKILASLKYEEKICIVLHYNSGYSIKEIANILGYQESSVRSKIARTKKKIKELYEGGVKNEFSEK